MRRTKAGGLEVFLSPADLSQLDDWTREGYQSAEDYLFWSRRVCGLACLQSLLHGWTDVRLSMGQLLALARSQGCFELEPSGKVHGLIYRPFMAWVSTQFGFDCRLVERTPIEGCLAEIHPGTVMIASVSPEIRDPEIQNPRRGGHLVLVHEVENGMVRFHNPSGYSHNSQSASLPITVFEQFHADRGVLVTRTD